MKKVVVCSLISLPVSIIGGIGLFYVSFLLIQYIQFITGNLGTNADVLVGFIYSIVITIVGFAATFIISFVACYRRLSKKGMTEAMEYGFPRSLLGGVIITFGAQLILLLFWREIAISTFAQLSSTVFVWLVAGALVGIIGFDVIFISGTLSYLSSRALNVSNR